ncbi:MAG: hypothetical protein VX764_07905 [Planctomycetota bacterium]|nr:hypothetical protein [Planctomycetota bacterium]
MNLVEKILWGFFALLLVAALGYGLLVGLPSTIPAIAMKSEKITEQKLRSDLTDEQVVEFNEMLNSPSSSTGGASSRRPQTEIYRINKPLLDRLGNIAECQRELMMASSDIQENGSLKVFDIRSGSLLDRVGLRENDVLKSINGLSLDFGSLGEVMDSHGESLKKLRSGNPVVIQIERRGTLKALVIDPTGI